MRTQQELRVLFEQRSFYIGDIRLVVLLDGDTIYDGGFKAGVDRIVPVFPGLHRIETQLHVTSRVCRTKAYEVTIGDAPRHTAELHYSRFWGNFKKQLTLNMG